MKPDAARAAARRSCIRSVRRARERRLFADHALAADFLPAAGGIRNDPVPGAQLHGLTTGIGDDDRVRPEKLAVFDRRAFRGESSAPRSLRCRGWWRGTWTFNRAFEGLLFYPIARPEPIAPGRRKGPFPSPFHHSWPLRRRPSPIVLSVTLLRPNGLNTVEDMTSVADANLPDPRSPPRQARRRVNLPRAAGAACDRKAGCDRARIAARPVPRARAVANLHRSSAAEFLTWLDGTAITDLATPLKSSFSSRATRPHSSMAGRCVRSALWLRHPRAS